MRAGGGRKMQPEMSATTQSQQSTDHIFQTEIQQRVGQRNFDHWFRDKTSWKVRGDELSVGVGSPFLLSWMQKHFRKAVLETAQHLLGPSARVRFEVDAHLSRPLESNPDRNSGATLLVTGEKDQSQRSSTEQSSTEKRASTEKRGRRFADLADFVQGKCNELPLTAARRICDSPGAKYNPLFLHGGVGTGKTHLLEGIYKCIRKKFPALRVVFLSSEAFANYFTQALREHTLPAFRQRFRNVDVLLVDDIDFLDGKRVIQEEFLHTFKQLESHGRQIVLSSDRHPRLLSKLSDELTTRFLSGMVCRLESPDFETRRKIVTRKAKRMDARFATEALRFVAQRFKNNVRELTGALNCLETYFHMTGKRIGLKEARDVLSEMERDCVRIIRIADVEQTVCEFFGLEPRDLKSPKRQRSISQPRMLAMYLIRKHTRAAYNEIGQYFGGRNHTTVMSAEKKVQSWLENQTSIQVSMRTWPLHDVLETIERQLHAC